MHRILDANYNTPDLKEEVEKMTHLTKLQRTLLLALLKKHEPLFDSQLGDWKSNPVEIPLKENHALSRKSFSHSQYTQRYLQEGPQLSCIHWRTHQGESF